MNEIIKIYVTTMPVIFSGVLNMFFCKSAFYKRHNKPIDCHKVWFDNKRILGDNKTYIGFVSMIVICVVFSVVYGAVLAVVGGDKFSAFYENRNNTPLYNILTGFLLGFAYMLFELPNSFIKRRIDIPDGKTVKHFKGILFFVIDQIDSMFGVMLVVACFARFSFGRYMFYVFLGGLTHIVINLGLYLSHVRRNL